MTTEREAVESINSPAIKEWQASHRVDKRDRKLSGWEAGAKPPKGAKQ